MAAPALGAVCKTGWFGKKLILNEDLSQYHYQSAVMNNHSTQLQGLYEVIQLL